MVVISAGSGNLSRIGESAGEEVVDVKIVRWPEERSDSR
jgi:hypothetical protein